MRHGNTTFVQIFQLLDAAAAIGGIVTEEPGCPPIFGIDTLGQAGALYQKIPVEVREALRRDEVEVVMEDPTKVVVRPKELLMVDTDGRFIFRKIEQVGPADWNYGFDRSIQPSYAEILERLEHALQRKIGISAAAFEMCAEKKKLEIIENPLFANLFLGQYARPFAIALPQMEVPKKGGLGELLARTIIPAGRRGYLRRYTERQFVDNPGDTLVSNVETFAGSRQERLIAALAEGPQVLLVFLNCLQGASINAARELIQTLPEEFILGGTLVNAPVIAAYPEIAAASGKCPLYFAAADVFQHGNSLGLYPYDDGVRFAYWRDLGGCCGFYSGSVAVLA